MPLPRSIGRISVLPSEVLRTKPCCPKMLWTRLHSFCAFCRSTSALGACRNVQLSTRVGQESKTTSPNSVDKPKCTLVDLPQDQDMSAQRHVKNIAQGISGARPNPGVSHLFAVLRDKLRMGEGVKDLPSQGK